MAALVLSGSQKTTPDFRMTFAYGVHSPVRTMASLEQVSFLNSSCGTSVTRAPSVAEPPSSPGRLRVLRGSRGDDDLFNHHLAQHRVQRLMNGISPLDSQVDALPAGSGVQRRKVMDAYALSADLIAQFAVQQSRPLHGSTRVGHYLDFNALVRIGHDLHLGCQLVQAHPVRD